MKDPALFVRPELRALSRYHLDLTPSRHKLDQNEVPWDLPQRFISGSSASVKWRASRPYTSSGDSR